MQTKEQVLTDEVLFLFIFGTGYSLIKRLRALSRGLLELDEDPGDIIASSKCLHFFLRASFSFSVCDKSSFSLLRRNI